MMPCKMATAVVLLVPEAEIYIKELELITPDLVGSPRFLVLHQHLEKVNMQSVLNATSLQEEFIKELLVSYDKMPVLVHNLVCMEVWRNRILPHLCNILQNAVDDFTITISIHHELTILTLLETTLFHEDACENVGEAYVDLVDYIHRRLLLLMEDQEVELEDLKRKVDFHLAIKALPILRYTVEHLGSLPLAVGNRLLRVHDSPMALVSVLEKEPWVKKGLVYDQGVEGGWRKETPEDKVKINKVQAQPWISLLALLTDPEMWKMYDLNDYRKNRLLKLRPLITDAMLDQLPVLIDLKRFLEELFVFSSPAPKKSLILELCPVIWESLNGKGEDHWKSVAQDQCAKYFSDDTKQKMERAKLLDELYDTNLEHFIEDV